MTWAAALRHADRQIALWQRDGIGPAEALMALHNEPPTRDEGSTWAGTRWRQVRQQLAAWVMLHREQWEE